MRPVVALADQLRELVVALAPLPPVRGAFEARLARGGLTQAEDAAEHVGIFFLPWRPATGEVLLVHHRKSGKWIAPGGHVERGEGLRGTVEREVREELGLLIGHRRDVRPFLLTITDIDSPGWPCRRHFDVWYLLPMGAADVLWDEREFHAVRWLGIEAARALSGDARCLEAFEAVERRFLRGGGQGRAGAGDDGRAGAGGGD